MEITPNNPKAWLTIDPNGVVTGFDEAWCKQLSDEYRAGRHDDHRALAHACWALRAATIEECAKVAEQMDGLDASPVPHHIASAIRSKFSKG